MGETSFENTVEDGRARDERLMRLALEVAAEASAAGEVPIGCVIVSADDKVLSTASNRTRRDTDPTAHAEIVALRLAAHAVSNYRLTGVSVYSTIEPCAMCAGALIQARVARLVFGAHEPRAGAVKSIFRILDSSSLNHQLSYTGGVLADEARALMQKFFLQKRLLQSRN